MYLQFEVQIAQRHTNIVRAARDRLGRESDLHSTMKENLKADERRSKAASMRAKAVLYRAIQKVPYCRGESIDSADDFISSDSETGSAIFDCL